MTTSKQRGITLTGALMGMIVLALAGLFAAKLLPAYLDYFAVQKIIAATPSRACRRSPGRTSTSPRRAARPW